MLRGWTGFLLDRWDAMRGSYWFLPALLTLLSGALAVALLELDRRFGADAFARVPWIGGTSPETARSVLATLTGAMMTVTGVVFSITIVALTLTSSQFGPRLLRTFLHDRGSQLALGAFLATFIFDLLVLQAIEDADRVPELALAASIVLAVASLFVLIYFIHHTASSIQASSVIAAVAAEIDQQIPSLFPERLGQGAGDAPLREVDRDRLDRVEAEGDPLRSGADGYLRVVDAEALLREAREGDLLLRVPVRPGDFVTRGDVLARLQPGAHADEARRARIAAAFLLGDHRTPVQDLEFLLDQLSEMAVRALSPGVNDPRTAVDCIRRLGGVLARLADRELPSARRSDGDGRLRVVAEPTDFARVAASCFDSIRRHGARDAQVVSALLEAIEAGWAHCSRRERRAVLEEHAREIQRAFVEEAPGSKRDRERVDAAFDRALARLEQGARARLEQGARAAPEAG